MVQIFTISFLRHGEPSASSINLSLSLQLVLKHLLHGLHPFLKHLFRVCPVLAVVV
ncbi:unnamed protein product [Protopolystoma xenopodis]|uniref:Uncharacterized protein n=1 Tax=Protopolystoma xenopodis TaxID=117903 RepID=A0A448X8U4_9PLAT|nr:unnamed protein product [Protopolystoma xenopodis]